MTEAAESDYTLEGGIPEGCSFERIALDNIEATAATQVRVKLDQAIIEQYTEDFRNGAKMPPLDVFREENSERNVLADGFHRQRAAINAKWGDIGCIVHTGDMRAALMFALGANAGHGLRRSNRDKRHAVEMALKDPVISMMTQQDIADICRVTRKTIRRIKHDLLCEDDDSSSGNNGTKSHSPTVGDPTADDFRDDGVEPTQQEVDLEELRGSMKGIRALPYDGPNAIDLAPTKDDIADAEYCSTWLAGLVIKYRSDNEEVPEGD